MNRLTKRLLFILAVMTLLFSPLSAYAEIIKENTTDYLHGVVYNEVLHEITTKEDFDVKFQVEEFKVVNGKLNLSGKLYYEDSQVAVDSKGQIYKTQNEFYKKANGITVEMDDTDTFEFLTFTVEEVAVPELLLPANQDLAGTTVIKIAMRIKDTNKVIYIEDTIPEKSVIKEMHSLKIDNEQKLGEIDQELKELEKIQDKTEKEKFKLEKEKQKEEASSLFRMEN